MTKKIIHYLGDMSQDYRSLMRYGTDIRIGEIAISQKHCVIVEQTHSALIHTCTLVDRGSGMGDRPKVPVCDGMSTDQPGVFLLIRTADCTPVLFSDSVKMVVSAVHSGREGTRRNICKAAIDNMVKRWDCRANDIFALIGAGICARHYQVSDEIYDEFFSTIVDQGFDPSRCNDNHIDIQDIIKQQLAAAGIPAGNVVSNDICTYEDLNYCSYRRDGSLNRQINLIGISYG
ncbi:MAG: polyphenol oxidase family protein [Candidatus Cloacimonetes bacterium]|nr:polyphenol oxidase family protein [Candidatus Cloacimonadota bacterium]